ncbi:Fasciclin-domain-containing protein [Terfezia boudieri ATCC MYA-4762]|uniref:Fasciclin-domain-containing protein n=1 Tax=Terfezia boudieri ATCC MYA-4762 TaxID=1051890 RepID=A0A3N4LJ22_9PEZI|nr:Fasciclin-domain-containing protein [Terfezia boudieri ATCC MYA-4762]
MQLNSAFCSLFAVTFTAVYGQSAAPNLTSILSSIPELASVNDLVLATPALLELLMNWPTNLTIVAPSNGAFDELKWINSTARDSASTVGNSIDIIEAILFYHILNGRYLSSLFVQGNTAVASTLLMNNTFANLPNNAPQVILGRNDGIVTFYSGLGIGAKVERADILFNQGVIHIIDHVLNLPYTVSETAAYFSLTALSGALVKTGLLETFDNTPGLTIFAPNNAAFQIIGNIATGLSTSQLTEVLNYHAVNHTIYDITGAQAQDIRVASVQGGELTINENQGGWFVNGARIIGGKEGGIVVGNGIVYIIDGVLNPAHGEITTTFTPNPILSTQPPAFLSASFVTEVPFITELVTGTPTSSATETPTSGSDVSSSTTLEAIPISFAALVIALFMSGLGGFFMV